LQDTLLACRLITSRDTFIGKEDFMNIMLNLDMADPPTAVPMPTVLKPRPLWTGKQVFSMFLPEGLNMRRKSKGHSDNDKLDLSSGDTQVGLRHVCVQARLCACAQYVGCQCASPCSTYWLSSLAGTHQQRLELPVLPLCTSHDLPPLHV
jgi:hypothetical protein